MSQMEGILKCCSFGFKRVVRYTMVFMLLVNAVCSIKNVNENSRATTKYAYLKSSDIRGPISHSIVITLICGFFLRGSGGSVRVISMFCRKTAFSFFISIVFLKANLCMLMKLFISACVTHFITFSSAFAHIFLCSICLIITVLFYRYPSF